MPDTSITDEKITEVREMKNKEERKIFEDESEITNCIIVLENNVTVFASSDREGATPGQLYVSDVNNNEFNTKRLGKARGNHNLEGATVTGIAEKKPESIPCMIINTGDRKLTIEFRDKDGDGGGEIFAETEEGYKFTRFLK